jgi:hypothetical protein
LQPAIFAALMCDGVTLQRPGNHSLSIPNAACYFGVIKMRTSRESCPNQIAKAHSQTVGLLLKRVLLCRQESDANKGSSASTFRPSHIHLIAVTGSVPMHAEPMYY